MTQDALEHYTQGTKPETKSDVDRAVDAAWADAMSPPHIDEGKPGQVGPYDGAELYTAHVPGFLQQAKASLSHWLTVDNLDWWIAAAQELALSKYPAPGFHRLLEIKSVLKTIARRQNNNKTDRRTEK
ncbi:hypothetical protein V5T82_14985 [Magnetovibrio sp. PR-2]|uniref:hypothetical protein n=1 Tax=Magnetovibrio sp. PR-2 TaxID=3120356 RepID=UPI002FCE34F0